MNRTAKTPLIVLGILLLCGVGYVVANRLQPDKPSHAVIDAQLLRSVDSIRTELVKQGFSVAEITESRPLDCRSGVLNKRNGTAQQSYSFTLTYTDTAQADNITDIVKNTLQTNPAFVIEPQSRDTETNTVDIRAKAQYYSIRLTFTYTDKQASVHGSTKCL